MLTPPTYLSALGRPPTDECTWLEPVRRTPCHAERAEGPSRRRVPVARIGSCEQCRHERRSGTITSGTRTPVPPAADRRVSARVGSISESATLAVDAKAKALKAAGRPVIGFGAGEPDFPTPDYIVDAAVEACRNPKYHRYTPAGGLPELKAAIAAKTLRDSGYEVDASQVLVTNGGKQAIYEAFAAILDPGDEVIVPAPYWTTYPESIRLAGGVPVDVVADETTGYRVSRGAARGGPHRAHQGAALRLAVQPDRRGLQPRPRPRRSAAGPSSTACGCSPTRSTSTWSTATRCSPRCPRSCRSCATSASWSTAWPRRTR